MIGSTTTALRLADELQRAGERVVAVVPDDEDRSDAGWVLDEMAEHGAEVHAVAAVREHQLRQWGIEAAIVVGVEDVTALRLALTLEDIAPSARLVLEMSNPDFGARLSELVPQVTVLSAAQLAAPSFVAAALSDEGTDTFDIGGRTVVAGPRSAVGGEILAVLGDSHAHSAESALGDDGDIVLGTQMAAQRPVRLRRSGWWGAFVGVFDSRLRWVVAILCALMVISTVYFRLVGGMDWLMALYTALTASTLTGIGDINDLSLAARFGGVVIQLCGLILSSGITAVIVDALISARLTALAGGVRGRPRHHVVVCGLGRVGKEVAMQLHAQHVPVVGIEIAETAGALACRAAKIPVVISEVTDKTVLQHAGVADAHAVLAVTDNDAVNLEIALTARSLSPDARIVTRLFDHELARRVEQRFALGPTRSVSLFAAPAFAAAALGRRRERVVSIGRRVLVFTELTIQAGSRTGAGVTLATLNAMPGVRVLAHQREGESTWQWSPQQVRLTAGDRIAVAATRHGLAGLLHNVKRPGRVAPAVREIDERPAYEAPNA